MTNWSICLLFLRAKGYSLANVSPAELASGSNATFIDFMNNFTDICSAISASGTREFIPVKGVDEKKSAMFKFVLDDEESATSTTFLVPYESQDTLILQLFDEVMTFKKLDKAMWDLALVGDNNATPDLSGKKVCELSVPVLKLVRHKQMDM